MISKIHSKTQAHTLSTEYPSWKIFSLYRRKKIYPLSWTTLWNTQRNTEMKNSFWLPEIFLRLSEVKAIPTKSFAWDWFLTTITNTYGLACTWRETSSWVSFSWWYKNCSKHLHRKLSRYQLPPVYTCRFTKCRTIKNYREWFISIPKSFETMTNRFLQYNKFIYIIS